MLGAPESSIQNLSSSLEPLLFEFGMKSCRAPAERTSNSHARQSYMRTSDTYPGVGNLQLDSLKERDAYTGK
jgi:hypothetical protein